MSSSGPREAGPASGLAALLLAAASGLGCAGEPPPPVAEAPPPVAIPPRAAALVPEPRPVDLVEPLVDSAHSRWFFFNSASRPFGMVNLSPDTAPRGIWNSGYRYGDGFVHHFSHVHAWQLSGVPVMPGVGECLGRLGSERYGSRFSHDDEQVDVGYHRVFLQDPGIGVELTSTLRVGLHRYTFPRAERAHVLFDLAAVLGPGDTGPARVRRVSDSEIAGRAVMLPTRYRPTPAIVHFVARLDRPAASVRGWRSGELLGEIDELEGEDIGAWFEFPTSEGEVRLLKVGLSWVGEEQARRNLEAELPHWDFDAVVEDSRLEWDELLGRIRVKGGSLDARRRFYTDLWHAFLGRRVVSDIDGSYADWTSGSLRVRRVELDEEGRPAFRMYNSDAFWGAQWTIQTLWQLIAPEISEDFVRGLLQMARDGGLVPRGPSGGNYTHVMTGASTTPFVVGAWMKGARGFDGEEAYAALARNHSERGMMAHGVYEHDSQRLGGVSWYLSQGWVPYPLPPDDQPRAFHHGAGQTLEYAFQDWALSEMAADLGRVEDAALLRRRALNYRHLFDPEWGWMRPLGVDGSRPEEVELLRTGHGFIESNAVQATWFVPHDLLGLAELMGGREAAVEKLDRSFQLARPHRFVAEDVPGALPSVRAGRVYVNYGNQPSMQSAMIFNWLGAPWLTQKWSRAVVDELYSGLTPFDGYHGDEDQGLMGSLAVLMKIGLFSMRGGSARTPIYEIGSPIFDEITITRGPSAEPGRSFVIEAPGAGEGRAHVQSATLNGAALDRPWFRHEILARGGRLELVMGVEPNRAWGADPAAAPPSLSGRLRGRSSSVTRAADHFAGWPAGADPAEVARRVARDFVDRPLIVETDSPRARHGLHYSEACTWVGGLSVAELTGDRELVDALVAKFEPFLAGESARHVLRRAHVDHRVIGIVPLRLFRLNGDERSARLGLELADAQWESTRADGLTAEARDWVDDAYMIPALQVEAWRATGRDEYLDRAARTLAIYVNRFQQPDGLFLHGPESPFRWGRGNGWMAAGLTETLRELAPEDPRRAVLEKGYFELMIALLARQGPDGAWRQLLDRPASRTEMSGTALFAFAFATGVQEGWLDADTFGPAARRAWLALVAHLEPSGRLRDVCIGTNRGRDERHYLERPFETGDLHGQAPLLWTAAALLRTPTEDGVSAAGTQ